MKACLIRLGSVEEVKQFIRIVSQVPYEVRGDKLDFLFQALVKTSRLETGVIQLDKKPGRLFDTVAQRCV